MYCIQTLEKVFKNISYDIIKSTLKVKIKSMVHKFHAAFCDEDLDPYRESFRCIKTTIPTPNQ